MKRMPKMTLSTLECERSVQDRPALSVKPNALRHGLTATRYVSDEMAQRVRQIRQELVEIHRPESAEELQLVERLAIAQARLFESEAAWDDRLRWQRTNAFQLFDRGESQRFETDLKAWRASPQGMMSVFGQTWHSAIFLRDLWKCIVDSIEFDICITYGQVRDMILALGSDWRVDQVDVARGRVMSAFLSLEPEPRATIERWVGDSRDGRDDLAPFDDDLDRAHNFLIAAPTQEKAREFLKTLAEEQFGHASILVKTAQAIYERERTRCTEITPGHPLGDASDVRNTLRIRRYLTTAENRADKIERRLLALKKCRVLRDHRSAKPTLQPTGASLSQPHEAIAMSVSTTDSTDDSGSSQADVIKDDASLLRNEAPAAAAQAPEAQDHRAPRRPDPKKLAKSWREKAGLTRSRKYQAEIDPPTRK